MNESSDLRVPNDWAIQPLGTVVEVLDALRKPLNGSERSTMQGTYPYYGANGQVGSIDRWIFDEPLILMAEDGGYFDEYETRPIAYLVKGKCWVNNHAHVLRVIPGIERRWVYYCLVHRDIRPFINSGTRTKLNQADMRRIGVPLPPLCEQRKIAAILSSVDDAIESTQAVIDQLGVVKKAMMAELLTRGLPGRHTKFKQTEIGEVPEGWEVARLRDCADRVTDGTHQAPEFAESGVAFLMVKSISSGRVRWGEIKFVSEDTYLDLTKKWRPARGDVLYTAVGTYGVAVAVDFDQPFTFQRHIAQIRPSRSRLRSGFLAHFLNSPSGKRQADLAAIGNAQPTVTLKSLSAFLLPTPPLEEQEEIEKVVEAASVREASEASGLAALHALKSALMSVLLTGELRVTPDEAAP